MDWTFQMWPEVGFEVEKISALPHHAGQSNENKPVSEIFTGLSLLGPAGGVHEGLGWAGRRVQGPRVATQGIQGGGFSHTTEQRFNQVKDTYPILRPWKNAWPFKRSAQAEWPIRYVTGPAFWLELPDVSEIPTGCDQEIGKGDRGEPLQEGGGWGGGGSTEGLDETKRTVGPNAGGFTQAQITLECIFWNLSLSVSLSHNCDKKCCHKMSLSRCCLASRADTCGQSWATWTATSLTGTRNTSTRSSMSSSNWSSTCLAGSWPSPPTSLTSWCWTSWACSSLSGTTAPSPSGGL